MMSRSFIIQCTLSEDPMHMGMDIVLILLAMAAIFALAWLTTRALSKRMTKQQNGEQLHMKERVMLGKDRQIVLLQVGKQFFLAGVTAQNIHFSQVLETPEEIVQFPDFLKNEEMGKPEEKESEHE